jgi:hypothetical protein
MLSDQLFRCEVTTGAVERFPIPANAQFGSVSPDGRLLAFDSNLQSTNGAYTIWLLDLATDSLTYISVQDSGEWRAPQWSPTGDAIVHMRYVNGVSDPDIYTMTPLGQVIDHVASTRAFDFEPAWSRDGQRILWSRGSTGSSATDGLWISARDGSQPRLIAAGASHGTASPGDTALAFNYYEASTVTYDLWTSDFSGGRLRPLLTALLQRQFNPPEP